MGFTLGIQNIEVSDERLYIGEPGRTLEALGHLRSLCPAVIERLLTPPGI